MSYDPKIEALSLAGFISWLEKHDPNKEYVWAECDTCACAQYIFFLTGTPRKWPEERDNLENLAAQRPHTYGALLARAKAAHTTA